MKFSLFLRRHPALLPGILFALVLFGVAHPALAQSVTLTANKTVADGKLVPVLTWNSAPQADSTCIASGGWSGTKAGQGTETLAQITASASYKLTCSWPSQTGTATVTWTLPTKNTDGSDLTNLAGTHVYAGLTPDAVQAYDAPGSSTTTKAITGLAAGTWYFKVRPYNTNGVEADDSNVVTKTFTAAPLTAAATASITIRPVPAPAVLNTVAIVAAQPLVTPVFKVASDGRSVGVSFRGLIPVGRKCGAKIATWRGYSINRVQVLASEVWPAGIDTTDLAAACGAS